MESKELYFLLTLYIGFVHPVDLKANNINSYELNFFNKIYNLIIFVY